jgi:hypothetical protein
MNLQEIEWGLDCIDLAQDGEKLPVLDSTAMSSRFIQNMGKALTSLKTVGF